MDVVTSTAFEALSNSRQSTSSFLCGASSASRAQHQGVGSHSFLVLTVSALIQTNVTADECRLE